MAGVVSLLVGPGRQLLNFPSSFSWAALENPVPMAKRAAAGPGEPRPGDRAVAASSVTLSHGAECR